LLLPFAFLCGGGGAWGLLTLLKLEAWNLNQIPGAGRAYRGIIFAFAFFAFLACGMGSFHSQKFVRAGAQTPARCGELNSVGLLPSPAGTAVAAIPAANYQPPDWPPGRCCFLRWGL